MVASSDEGLWCLLGESIIMQATENIPNVEAVTQSTTFVMESLKLLTLGKVGVTFGYDYHVVLANQRKLDSLFPDALVIVCRILFHKFDV